MYIPSMISRTTLALYALSLVLVATGIPSVVATSDLSLSAVHPPLGPSTGQTTVVFEGNGFTNSTKWYCDFEYPSLELIRQLAVYLNETKVGCTAPPCDYGACVLPHTVTVSIRNETMLSYPASNVTYTYHEEIVLSSLSTDVGFTGDTVSVSGTGFENSTFLLCKFGDQLVSATFVSTTVVDCQVPPNPNGEVALTISNNGQQFSTSELYFLYQGDIEVASLSPASGPISGGTAVTVGGENFFTGAQCLFGTEAAASTWNSYTEIVCTSPSIGSPQAVALEVANGPPYVNYTDSGILYQFIGSHTVATSAPVYGPHSGGSEITITGSGFYNSPDSDCRFRSPTSAFPDQFSGAATFVTASVVRCVTPDLTGVVAPEPLPTGLTVEVSYANNGLEYVDTSGNSAATFVYYTTPVISSLSIHTAPFPGGSPLTITGSDFVAAPGAELRCMFSNVGVTASVTSDTLIVCTTPMHPPGLVPIEVSNNNYDYTNQGLAFRFHVDVEVDSVSPDQVGANANATLSITGSSFFDPAPYHAPTVHLGTFSSAGTYVTSSLITVNSPVGLPADTHMIARVSFNGGVDQSHTGVELGIDLDLAVTSITPDLGTPLGGTRVVLIGSGFRDRPDMKVRFGPANVVPAVWMSESAIYCDTPPTTAGVTAVAVTSNNVHYTQAIPSFTFVNEPVVSSVSVAAGPYTGGTNITLTLSSPVTQSSHSVCRFGEGYQTVPSVYIDANTVVCTSPVMVAPTNVTLAFSHNGVDFHPSTFTYYFYAEPVVSSLSSQAGSTDGGLAVTITGDRFTNEFNNGLRVRFGSLPPVTPTVTSDKVIVAVTPAASNTGSVVVEVSLNAQDYSESGVLFTYIDPISISLLLPQSGPESGGSTVTVRGSGFSNRLDLRCKFGSSVVPARWWNTTEITCTSPSGSGASTVAVSNNGGGEYTSTMPYQYYADPVVYNVTTRTGPSSGGSTVSVVGDNFINSVTPAGQETMCRFGDIHHQTVATFVSSTLVTCTSPAHAAGMVSVTVANNGYDFTATNSSAHFTYYLTPVLQGLQVNLGPRSGGTDVVLTGSNFFDTLGFRCKVAGTGTEQTAYFVTTSSASCTTPPHTANGTLTVEMSLNHGADWTSSGVAFYYYDQEVVTALSPSTGISSGGTLVSVLGSKFIRSDTLRCRWDGNSSLTTTATWINSGVVTCLSVPGASASSHDVDVAINGVTFTSSGISFSYYTDPVPTSVHPTIGPATGGTTVSIRGTGFFVGASANTCSFGGITAAASFVSTTLVTCVSPSTLPIGSQSVSFAANGVDFSTGFTYTAHARLVVQSVSRWRGPISGGSNLTVVGDNFMPSSLATCSFGNTSAPVAALYESSTSIYCVTPAVASAGEVEVRVSMNGQDYSHDFARFRYVVDPVPASLAPATGPEAGDTLVTVYGSDFVHSSRLRCRFGTKTPVVAEWITATQLECRSPPGLVSEGFLPVEVSINDLDYTSAAVSYFYHSTLAVTSLLPNSGPTLGGTLVTVIGTGFVWSPQGPVCRLGGDLFVRASYVSATQVTCTTPLVVTNSSMQFDVSNNAQQYTNSGINFTYVDPVHVTAVNPSSGSYTGGVAVTVSGTGFLFGKTYVQFGDAEPILVTLISTTQFVVTSPEYSAGTYPVEVSVNEDDWSSDGQSFTFTGNPVVSLVSPHHGPMSGQTLVQVNGVNFLNLATLTCKFGSNLYTDAIWINPFNVRCRTPGVPGPTTVAVEISNTNTTGNFTTNDIKFRYDPLISLTARSPVKGPISGGTVVNITGTNMLSDGEEGVTCRFGNFVVNATFADNSTARCQAPRGLSTGAVSLDMSNNGQDYTTSGLTFTYQSDITITSINPVRGPITGSSTVTVVGSNFVNTGDLRCRFGNVGSVAASFTSATEIECTSPSTGSPTSVALEVTNNVYDYSNFGTTYYYLAVESVSALSPVVGTAHGDSFITVSGSDFVDVDTLRCRFSLSGDSTTVYAVWRSATAVECTSPTHYHWYGNATVEVANNGQDFTSGGAEFMYLHAPSVSVVSPAYGPVSGLTTVTVGGTNFTSYTSVYCRFDKDSAPATVINATAVSCDTPGVLQATQAVVEVSVDGGNTWTNGSVVTFTYEETLALLAINPQRGPAAGGTLVTMTGTDFPNTPSLSCRIGTTIIPASYTSSSQLTCTTPAGTAGQAPVDISSNGEDWTSSFKTFQYDDVLSIISVEPTSGPAAGGTVVTLKGTALVNSVDLQCRFDGGAAIDATYYGQQMLSCPSPTHAAGTVTLEVTTNALDWFPASNFEYYNNPVVSSIYPTHGPRTGSTDVTILGSGFLPGANFSVSIGYEYGINCPSVNATHAICKSPSIAPYAGVGGREDGQGVSGVQISNNLKDWTSSAVTYTFDADLNITSATPQFARASVGKVVTLTGSNFINTGADLRCKFGAATPVTATFVSPYEITCPLAAHAASDDVIEVTTNGLDWTTSQTFFTYYADETVTSITPARSLITGDSLITVKGSNFIYGRGISCFFAALPAVPAIYLNSTNLVCQTPEVAAAGAVVVEVSNNGVDKTSDGVTITYYDPTIVSATPSVLKEEASSQTIVLTGANLAAVLGTASTVECQWSSSAISETRRTTATGVNGTAISCPTAVALHIGVNNVTVVIDDTTYFPSTAQVQFTPCPPGYYCQGASEIPCPVGTYCPNPGRNDNYTVCAPGTYQHQTTQTECITCDAGFYCPEARMSAPILCPAGFICKAGTVQPNILCIPGHYCPTGTAVDTEAAPNRTAPFPPGINADNEWDGTLRLNFPVTFPFNPYPGFPLLCAAGYYCPGNIPYHPNVKPTGATSYTHVPGNITSPQPCLPRFSCPRGSRHPQGIGACPEGYFCPVGASQQPCPPGSAARGEGNLVCTDCIPGEYAQTSASATCLPCPVGRVCPHPRQINPSDCPAGFVCETSGLAEALTLCPAGYFCPNNTATANPQSSNATLAVPQPCPAKYFCMPGAQSGTPWTLDEIDTVLPANFPDITEREAEKVKRPQPCQEGRFCGVATAGQKGQGVCPVGHYCPRMHETPIPAPLGHYVGAPGRSVALKCPIGTYADTNGTVTCKKCPAGYYCPEAGTVYPIVCPPGTYRNEDDRNGLACLECPTGTVDMRNVERVMNIHDWAITFGDAAAECVKNGTCASLTPPSKIPGRPAGGVMHASPMFASPRFEFPTAQGTWDDVISGKYGTVVSAPAATTTEDNRTITIHAGDVGLKVNIFGQSVTYGSVRYDGTTPPAWWRPVLLTTKEQCSPCPAGFLCRGNGKHTLTVSDLCPAGSYCETIKGGSNWINRKQDCPSSHYCYPGAALVSMKNYVCEAGRYCEAGTAWARRVTQSCRAGWYCPPGTPMPNPPQFQCPPFTDSDPGASLETDCRDVNYDRQQLNTENSGFTELRPTNQVDNMNADGDIVLNKWEGCTLRFSLRGLRAMGIEYGYQLGGAFALSLNEIRYRQRSQEQQVRLRLQQEVVNATRTGDLREISEARMRLHLFQQSTTSNTTRVIDPTRIPMPPSLVTRDDVAGAEEIEVKITSEKPDLRLRVGLVVLHGRYVTETDLFQNRTSINITRPARTAATADETFFCVLENNIDLDLPLNLVEDPTRQAVVGYTANMSSTGLPARRDPFKSVATERSLVFQNDNQVSISAHMPYFSACQDYDSYTILYQVLEDQRHCSLAPVETTVFTTPWSPASSAAGDICEYSLKCLFEERIGRIEFLPRWYEAVTGTTLFHITREPNPISASANLGYFESKLNTKFLVPVRVARNSNIRPLTVPRKVSLSLRYHQVTESVKHLMTATLFLDQYEYPCVGQNSIGETIQAQCYQGCTVCKDPVSGDQLTRYDSATNTTVIVTPDVTYDLHISYAPLPYLDLLVLFAFDLSLYATIYAGVALLTLMSVMVFWATHRMFGTNHTGNIRLNFAGYFKMAVLPHYVALMVDAIVIGGALALIWIALRAAHDHTSIIPGDMHMFDSEFNPAVELDKLTMKAFFVGRYGVALFVFGLMVMYYGSCYLIPSEIDTLEEQVAGVHHSWKRSHLLTVSIGTIIFFVFVLEFSYSDIYANWMYLWIGLIHLGKLAMWQGFLHVLAERLLVDCLVLAFSLCQYVMLLGAPNYFHFLGGFFMTLWLDVVSAIYLLRWWRQYWPHCRLWLINKYRTRRGDEPIVMEQDDEDILDNAAYEMLSYLSYVGVAEIALLCTPVVYYYLLLFAHELHIYDLYPMPPDSIILYFVGVSIVVLVMVLTAVFLHNIQELKMDWRIFQYLEYTQTRFWERGNYWRPWSSQDVDLAIHPHFHSLDALCFSIHYYIMLMFYASGVMMMTIAIEMTIRSTYKFSSISVDRYNAWSDPLTLPLGITIVLGTIIAKAILSKVIATIDALSSKQSDTSEFEEGYEKVNTAIQCTEDDIRLAADMAMRVTTLGKDFKLPHKMPHNKLDYASDDDEFSSETGNNSLRDLATQGLGPLARGPLSKSGVANEYRIIHTPDQSERPVPRGQRGVQARDSVDGLLDSIMEGQDSPHRPGSGARPASRQDIKRAQSAELKSRAEARQQALADEHLLQATNIHRRMSTQSDVSDVLDEHRAELRSRENAVNDQVQGQQERTRRRVEHRRRLSQLSVAESQMSIPGSADGDDGDATYKYDTAQDLDTSLARIQEDQGFEDDAGAVDVAQELERYFADNTAPEVGRADTRKVSKPAEDDLSDFADWQ
eukprot:TRINITY_DN17_c0_g4_i1.p1 TRINITY_DN17_c0_g4~~TRINITY_DN17_c0_g4_i1.p1  ORF type:complete len:4695 (+),score=879.62 TRINITY_DN17_c0_g4_i1:301-14385(+)